MSKTGRWLRRPGERCRSGSRPNRSLSCLSARAYPLAHGSQRRWIRGEPGRSADPGARARLRPRSVPRLSRVHQGLRRRGHGPLDLPARAGRAALAVGRPAGLCPDVHTVARGHATRCRRRVRRPSRDGRAASLTCLGRRRPPGGWPDDDTGRSWRSASWTGWKSWSCPSCSATGFRCPRRARRPFRYGWCGRIGPLPTDRPNSSTRRRPRRADPLRASRRARRPPPSRALPG